MSLLQDFSSFNVEATWPWGHSLPSFLLLGCRWQLSLPFLTQCILASAGPTLARVWFPFFVEASPGKGVRPPASIRPLVAIPPNNRHDSNQPAWQQPLSKPLGQIACLFPAPTCVLPVGTHGLRGPRECKISLQGCLCLISSLHLPRQLHWFPWKPLKALAPGGS